MDDITLRSHYNHRTFTRSFQVQITDEFMRSAGDVALIRDEVIRRMASYLAEKLYMEVSARISVDEVTEEVKKKLIGYVTEKMIRYP